MSLPAVAKIGVGSTLAIGAPTSIYLTWDHITLYQQERDVLANDNLLTSNSDSSVSTEQKEVYVTTISHNNNKWSCVIKVKQLKEDISDLSSKKEQLKKHINNRLPVSQTEGGSGSAPSVKEEDKKLNKRKLVLGCSGKRIPTNDGSIKTELIIPVESKDSKLMVSLFDSVEPLSDS